MSFFDFRRCQRPDGSHYGTSGKCKKGQEVQSKEKTHAVAVTQGRFNIPHSGHAKLIKELLENAKEAYVILGKGKDNVDDNLRSLMLRRVLRKEGVDISRVKLIKGSTAASQLKDLIQKHGKEEVLFMLGSDQKKFLDSMGRSTGAETKEVSRPSSGEGSASSSAIRKLIDSKDVKGLEAAFKGDEGLARLAALIREEELKKKKS
jgi:FAD synthase